MRERERKGAQREERGRKKEEEGGEEEEEDHDDDRQECLDYIGREEPLGEGQPRSWPGKLRVAGSAWQAGTEGYCFQGH